MKKNIGDFGAYFSGIRVFCLIRTPKVYLVGEKIKPSRGSHHYRPQRYQDADALYAFKPNIWDFRLSHHLKGGEIFVATHLFESTQADTMLGTE